jgi:SAM-dependent methyltransferase
MRGLRPVSDHWGFDRGQPVDRYYIDRFMVANAGDIRGRVVEVGAPRYAGSLHGTSISQLDILDVDAKNASATILANLMDADALPAATFDCVILTQVLQHLAEPSVAVRTAMRALKPGGVLLLTVPVISRVYEEQGTPPWYWNFTAAGVRDLFSRHVPSASVDVRAHGNLRVARAFLEGRASDELSRGTLDYFDAEFAVVVTARAVAPTR